MKLLVWLILGVLVYLAVRKNMKASTPEKPRSTWTERDPDMPTRSNGKPSEPMVSCAQCQVFIPSSEAVRRGEHVFCCDEHAQQFSAQQ